MSRQIDSQQVIDLLSSLGQELEKKNEELNNLGIEKANTEKEYRIKLAQKILELKASGHSVTLISDLARGDIEIANYKFSRDLADTMFDTCRSSIASIRDRMDTGRSILSWLRAEFETK